MTRRYPWKKRRPTSATPTLSSFVRGVHEFRIVGFSGAGEAHSSILSGAFQVGGHTWALECGFDKPGHLASVFLELLTPYVTQDGVVAKAGLRIEDPLGRCPAAEWRSEEAHTFTVLSGGRSWTLSVPDEFRAHESRYVQDDRLTIICTVEVLQEKDGDSITTAADDFHNLLSLPPEPEPEPKSSESERKRHACMLPDVTFLVEETEIQAHRLLLAARSPVFSAELLGDMREGAARRVSVGDMRASTFRALIRFIYTDKLPIKAAKTTTDDDEASSSGSKAKCAARRRVGMACDLLAAADRYDLEKLKVMCEEVLSENMDVASVIPTLMAVHGRHGCRRLEASCVEYLASDADVYAAVKATDEYAELEESCSSFVAEVTDKVAAHKLAVISSKYKTGFFSIVGKFLSSVLGAKLGGARPQQQAKKNSSSVSAYNTSKVVSHTHEMRIPSFGVITVQTGMREFDQDTFRAHGHDWMIWVCPDKYTAGEKWVCVYIELLTDPGTAGVRAAVRFGVVDPYYYENSAPAEGGSRHIFTRKAPTQGYCLTTLKDAEQYYVAHDGSLTLQCGITVTNMMTCIPTSATSAGVGAPPANIARHLEELLASEKGSDVTFLVQDREIRAHKLVIAARSPVLYELVGAADTEDDIVIPVNDMKVAAFEAVLHFIYTGELSPMEATALASEDGVSIVGDMLAAACRLRLDTMRAKCETLLAKSMSKENASSTLELARRHHFLRLEDYCAEFISTKYVARYRADMRDRSLLARMRNI